MLGAKPELMPETAPTLRSHLIVAGQRDAAACRGRALLGGRGRTLLVADLHLEKGSAFAARGVLLPPYDTRATLAGSAR